MTAYDLEILIRTKKVGDDPSPPPDSGLKWTELASKVSLAKQAFTTVAAGAKQAYDFMKRGAELELARGRFDNLAKTIDSTADVLLGKLKNATNGMVSDAELVASASDIISLGLAKTEDQTIRLATASAKLGLDQQQLVLTFANNSKARLDALGLSVEDVTAKMEELQAQGFEGDAFDEAVLIGLEEKMTLLGDASETTAGKIQIMESNMANLKDQASLLVAQALEPAVATAAGVAENTNKIVAAVQNSKSPFGDLLFILNEVNKAFGGIPMDDYINDLRAAELQEQAAAARSAEMSEYYRAQAEALEAARQEVIDKANAERDAAHQTELLSSQSDQLNEQMARTTAVAAGAADQIARLAAQDEIAAQNRARLVSAFNASADPINELLSAQTELANSEGEWVTRTVSTAGQVANINAQLAADLSNEQKNAYQEILRTVDEGSAEWLSAYEALQNDLTDSQRNALIAQQADLANQPDRLMEVYTGDSEAAEAAQARIEAANEAIKQSYRETAAEAILAQNGVNEATLDLLVGIGYLTQEQADARLEFANTTTAIEELTASAEFNKLTVEQQAEAMNALIDGAARSAEEALALAQALDEIPTEIRTHISVTSDPIPNAPTGGGSTGAGNQGTNAGVTARALGGPFSANKIYRVGEGDLPEVGMLQSSGKLFMIPGERGTVFGNADAKGMMGGYTDQSQLTVNNYNMQAAAVTNALVQERRRSRLDAYMGVS